MPANTVGDESNARFSDYAELRNLVKENRGLLGVRVAELRDALPGPRPQRIRIDARERIRNELTDVGLDHHPAELPNAHEVVWVFVRTSDIGKIVRHLENPTLEPQPAEFLRDAAGRGESGAAVRLQKARDWAGIIRDEADELIKELGDG